MNSETLFEVSNLKLICTFLSSPNNALAHQVEAQVLRWWQGLGRTALGPPCRLAPPSSEPPSGTARPLEGQQGPGPSAHVRAHIPDGFLGPGGPAITHPTPSLAGPHRGQEHPLTPASLMCVPVSSPPTNGHNPRPWCKTCGSKFIGSPAPTSLVEPVTAYCQSLGDEEGTSPSEFGGDGV